MRLRIMFEIGYANFETKNNWITVQYENQTNMYVTALTTQSAVHKMNLISVGMLRRGH